MSLADLNFATAADAGRAMTVTHPDTRAPLKARDGEDMTITLLGQDSDTYIAGEYASRDKAVEARLEGLKFSSAESDAEAINALAKCIVTWHGIPHCWVDPSATDGDGKPDETPVQFSHQAAVKLLSNRGIRWLRTQVDKFIANRANFLPG